MDFLVQDMWLASVPNTSPGEYHYYASPEEAVAGICQKGGHDGRVGTYENHIATVEKLSCVVFGGCVLRAYANPEDAESEAGRMRLAATKISGLPYGHKVSLIKLFREDKLRFEDFEMYENLPEDEFYQRGVPRLEL